ncbi:DEAD/DEAH box helicase family protein [Sorangium sp. So ce1151]
MACARAHRKARRPGARRPRATRQASAANGSRPSPPSALRRCLTRLFPAEDPRSDAPASTSPRRLGYAPRSSHDGAGKAVAAITSMYRLIKFGDASRVLFLVDRDNLGRQALKEFQQYVAPDAARRRARGR